MSNERKPLLTEEQIQEMLAEAGSDNQLYWLRSRFPDVFNELIRRNPSREIRLAFLRGKTKRVLNLDMLFQDIKEWAADPNRKYPEWMSDEGRENINIDWIVKSKLDDWMEYKNSLQYEICSFASIIGLNPDDYFEEQIIE